MIKKPVKPRTVSKSSESSIPILMELQELHNDILHSLIGLRQEHDPFWSYEDSLIVDKKLACVHLCFVGLFQDLL